MISTSTATEVINTVLTPLAGLPACIAGSVVAAEAYALELHDTSDIDVFCYTDGALITAIERLVNHHFTLDERFERVRARWLRYGFKTWHTNSIKLHSPPIRNAAGDTVEYEVNLVYKLIGGRPLNSLSQVLESFDFGLLTMGYECETGLFRDLRGYLFPGLDPEGPLPLVPNKRDNWVNGFISRYNGLREAGRYGKYVRYGHDLSAVKDDMITGYLEAANYLRNRGDEDRIKLAEIYEAIAYKIETDAIDELIEANKTILVLDSLDEIMEALE